MHLVWNVVVKEVLRIFCILAHREESTSKYSKRITMAQYENGLRKDRHNNQSIRVIFETPRLAEPGLMAGVRCQMKFG